MAAIFAFSTPERSFFGLATGACLALALGAGACDSPSAPDAPPAESAAAPPAAPAAPPEPPRAPEIIVDRASVAIGKDRLMTGEPGLGDKVAALLQGKPAIAGQSVEVVAMRGARPSQVEAIVDALRAAKATSAIVKTATRDESTTAKLAVSFAPALADCAVVAWIGKDASIQVWPAGGGAPKRLAHGLAGPDITLGTDAMRAVGSGCSASEIGIGADETMTWGLVFDLATSALTAPGARASAVVLLPSAAPGKKIGS